MMKTFLYILQFCACHLPRSWVLGGGVLIGKLVYLIQGKKRQGVIDKNIDLILTHSLSPHEKKKLTKAMYKHMGMNIVEFLRLPLWRKNNNWKKWVTIEGESYLEEMKKTNKAFLLIGGHLGFYDFISLGLTDYGFSGSVITKDLRNKGLDEFWKETYQAVGNIHALPKKNSSRKIMKLIKEKQIVGFMMDQNMNLDNGLFAPLGKGTACTLNAPAILGQRFDLPILGVFNFRLPDNTYKWVIFKPFRLQNTNNKEEDLLQNTKRINEEICKAIHLFPEQWIWMHRRFKNQPEGMPPIY